MRYLIACLVSFLVLFQPSGVWAKDSIFDVFENVRKEKGALLLGAAQRTSYSLDKEECSVFVLMLEDELKRNWVEINKPFQQYDMQQLMKTAFGSSFDIRKLDYIPDYNAKRVLREVVDSGYRIEQKDGRFYPWLDYDYLYATYSDKINDEVKDYLSLCFLQAEFSAQSVSSVEDFCNKSVNFILAAEKFLKQYPVSYRKAFVENIYQDAMSDYLVKIVHGKDIIKDGKLNEAVYKHYGKTAKNNNETRLGWLSAQTLQAWQKEDYVYNEQIKKALSDVEMQIDIATSQVLEGLYVKRNGTDLFKPKGEKTYMILTGQKNALENARDQMPGKKSQYMIAELKGVAEKTIPVDMDYIPYPKTFVTEYILNARAWSFEDQTFAEDFIAYNNTPLWQLRILTDDEIIFESSVRGGEHYVFKYKQPKKETRGGKEIFVYELQREKFDGKDLMTVFISKEPSRDTLLGINYQYKAKIFLNGRTYEGFAFKPGEQPKNPDKLTSA